MRGTAHNGRVRKDGSVYSAKHNDRRFDTSAAFDFYCEYARFDFSRFDVSWLLNLYSHALEQIAKNTKVKESIRAAISSTLLGKAIASSDRQRLQDILIKYFC